MRNGVTDQDWVIPWVAEKVWPYWSKRCEKLAINRRCNMSVVKNM